MGTPKGILDFPGERNQFAPANIITAIIPNTNPQLQGCWSLGSKRHWGVWDGPKHHGWGSQPPK